MIRSHSSGSVPLTVEIRLPRDPGVGDGDVDAAEALDGLRGRRLEGGRVAYVGGYPDRPLADPRRRSDGGLLGSRSTTATEAPRHVQLPRGLEADPAGRAGHECDPAAEVVGGHRRETIRPPVPGLAPPA